MMLLNMKKWISLSIIFALLANQCSALYAAKPTKQKNTQIRRSVENAAREQSMAYWVERGEELAQANCDTGGIACVLNLLKPALQAENPMQATVCIPTNKFETQDKVCLQAVAFAQGAVHAAVSKSQNLWLYYDHKHTKVLGSDKIYTVKTDPFPVRETAPDVLELVSQWGVYYDPNLKALSNYFRGAAYPSTCGNEGKNTCHEEMIALLGLAFLATQQNDTAQEEACKIASKILKKKWNSNDGGLVVKGTIIALSVLDTPAAWDEIEKFVTRTSLPNGLLDVLGLLTVEGIADLGIRFNSVGYAMSTRYHNNSNMQFSYLDESEARKQGFKHPYNNPAFQYPHNNVFEEIGYLIGREAADGNKHAQKLAKKIMKFAISYVEYRNKKHPSVSPRQHWITTGGAAPAVATIDAPKLTLHNGHWPVIVGIMKGAVEANKPWSVTPNLDGAMQLIKYIFAKGFWDINAGTYLRIFNIAMAYGDSLTKKGTFPRLSPTSKGYVDTQARYKKIRKIKEMSEYADMAIFLASAFLSFASLSEALCSIYETSRWAKKQVSSLKKIAKYSKKAANKVAPTTIRRVTVTAATATTTRMATKAAVRSSKASVAATAATATTGTKTSENYKGRKKEAARNKKAGATKPQPKVSPRKRK